MERFKKLMAVVVCCILMLTIFGTHYNYCDTHISVLAHFDDPRFPD